MCCPTGTDNPNSTRAVGVRDQQQLALGRQAQGDVTFFARRMLLVNNRDEHWIIENRGRLGKIDMMLIEILGGLVGVLF